MATMTPGNRIFGKTPATVSATVVHASIVTSTLPSTKTKKSRIKAKDRRVRPGNCANCRCSEKETKLWRCNVLDPHSGMLCNACGLWAKEKGEQRPARIYAPCRLVHNHAHAGSGGGGSSPPSSPGAATPAATLSPSPFIPRDDRDLDPEQAHEHKRAVIKPEEHVSHLGLILDISPGVATPPANLAPLSPSSPVMFSDDDAANVLMGIKRSGSDSEKMDVDPASSPRSSDGWPSPTFKPTYLPVMPVSKSRAMGTFDAVLEGRYVPSWLSPSVPRKVRPALPYPPRVPSLPSMPVRPAKRIDPLPLPLPRPLPAELRIITIPTKPAISPSRAFSLPRSPRGRYGSKRALPLPPLADVVSSGARSPASSWCSLTLPPLRGDSVGPSISSAASASSSSDTEPRSIIQTPAASHASFGSPSILNDLLNLCTGDGEAEADADIEDAGKSEEEDVRERRERSCRSRTAKRHAYMT